jgi:di/tricarboxylate transporter
MPGWVALAAVLIVTMLLSDILNNAATAVIAAPLALALARLLEVNPDSFLMAVCIGASCAFLTPIGHQNSALIMGPGGYRFADYVRLGLPLEIIVAIVAVPAIMVFWPL